MESLPARKPDSSLSVGQIKLRQRVAELLADGIDVPTIARRLGKGDKAHMKKWRSKIRYWAATDEVFRTFIFQYTQGIMVSAIPEAGTGLSRRAGRGRVGEVKLLMEATKFHSPKMQHEHSGEIQIRLDIPRPVRVDTEDVVDGEVVD